MLANREPQKPGVLPSKRTAKKLGRDGMVAFFAYCVLQTAMDWAGAGNVDPELYAALGPLSMLLYRWLRMGMGMGPDEEYVIDASGNSVSNPY